MAPPENLDARLLRFRSDPGAEDAGALADALLTARRPRDASDVAATWLKRDPDAAGAHLAAGRAWMDLGDLLRAQKALLQAARTDPRSPAPYRWLGEVLLRRGDPARAVKVLEKARSLGSADPAVARLEARANRLARVVRGDAPPPRSPVAPQAPAPPGRREHRATPRVGVAPDELG
ncbi:MAG: tetratricopeptide repeat protein, partial [Myxococcota bacterium]